MDDFKHFTVNITNSTNCYYSDVTTPFPYPLLFIQLSNVNVTLLLLLHIEYSIVTSHIVKLLKTDYYPLHFIQITDLTSRHLLQQHGTVHPHG